MVFTTTRHSCEGRRHYEIASANLDGSGYKRLTHADGSDLLPTWSPDGSMIAFVSNRIAFEGTKERAPANSGDFNYFVMDSDGSNVRSLAPDILVRPWGGDSFPPPPPPPVWSPNGELAFRDWRTETLYTVHPEEPGVVTVVGQTSSDPAWSPDGEWIAWVHGTRDSDGRYTEETLFVAKRDGTDPHTVFQMDSLDNFYPEVLNLSWAPDGQSLRFLYAPHPQVPGLYEVSLDGSDLQLIADFPPSQWRTVLAWSPDGSRVAAFNASGYGPEEERVYTMAADGSDKRILLVGY